MPRQKTSRAVATVTGQDKNHPSRYRKRAEGTARPLGDPPSWMADDQRRAWKMFQVEMPWLAESDRALVEIATALRARLYGGDDLGVNAVAQLRLCLNAMGGTPSTRDKLAAPDEREDDPADAYFQ